MAKNKHNLYAKIPLHILKTAVSLPTAQTKTLLALYAHANWITGAAFPSQKTLAKYTGLSHSSVKRSLKSLANNNIIERSLVQPTTKLGKPVGHKRYIYYVQLPFKPVKTHKIHLPDPNYSVPDLR